jgi:hypothetical protein
MAIGLIACVAGLVGCPRGINERFRVDIQRHFGTEQEKNLILIAENTYPAREDVATLYPVGTKPEDLPEHVWWYYGQFGNMQRLPYAITADAIEYYTQQVRTHARDHLLGGLTQRFPNASELFYYSASIQYFASYEGEGGNTFSNVYVVSMIISFGESVGPGTGSGFGQERVVVLTPEGEVLQVQGDGEADVSIS